MRIALLSDTHSFLDPSVIKYLDQVDEIWHAGDIGSEEVLHQLKKIKPVRAVFGNIDNALIRRQTKETEVFEQNGVKVLMIHIAGAFGKYNPGVKALIETHKPQVLVCGHSHVCKVAFDKQFHLMYVNPGAAGNHGFHAFKTLLRFTLDNGTIKEMEVVELGKRGALVN
jgi:putative phosphoesterase